MASWLDQYMAQLKDLSPFGRDYLNTNPAAGYNYYKERMPRAYSGSGDAMTPGWGVPGAFGAYQMSRYNDLWNSYQAALGVNPETKWTDWLGGHDLAMEYQYSPRVQRQSVRPMQPRFLPFLVR